jgi:hypothetical protein
VNHILLQYLFSLLLQKRFLKCHPHKAALWVNTVERAFYTAEHYTTGINHRQYPCLVTSQEKAYHVSVWVNNE